MLKRVLNALGANLFANSIVAVNAVTGEYRGHFQTVHHDRWDSDMSNPPTHVDIDRGRSNTGSIVEETKLGSNEDRRD